MVNNIYIEYYILIKKNAIILGIKFWASIVDRDCKDRRQEEFVWNKSIDNGDDKLCLIDEF